MSLHTCPDCGLTHGQDDGGVSEPAAAPVVVESGPNEHDVEIEKLRTEADVKTAKIYAEQADEDLRAENERLRGELAGMKDTLAALQPPEPEPVPIPVPVPEPEPTPEPVVPPPPVSEPPKGGGKKDSGWWGGYR